MFTVDYFFLMLHQTADENYYLQNTLNLRQKSVSQNKHTISKLHFEISALKKKIEQSNKHLKIQKIHRKNVSTKPKFIKCKSTENECQCWRKKCLLLEQLLSLSETDLDQIKSDSTSNKDRDQFLISMIDKTDKQSEHTLKQIYTSFISRSPVWKQYLLQMPNNKKQNVNLKIVENDAIMDGLMQAQYHMMQNKIKQMSNEILQAKEEEENDKSIIVQKAEIIAELNMKMLDAEEETESENIQHKQKCMELQKQNEVIQNTVFSLEKFIMSLKESHKKQVIELRGLLDRELYVANTERESLLKEVHYYREKWKSIFSTHNQKEKQIAHNDLADCLDQMRHEMKQINQENVTMATVMNSLREIVRKQEVTLDKQKETDNEVFNGLYDICKSFESITGEDILSVDGSQITLSPSNMEMKIPQLVQQFQRKARSLSRNNSLVD